MQHIPSLLEKLQALYNQPREKTAIDADLMLDYTRRLYAVLLDWRATVPSIPPEAVSPGAASVRETTTDGAQTALVQEQSVPAPEEERATVTPALHPEAPGPGGHKPGQAHPHKDIRKTIGINDKYQIISELFHNDKEAYDAAIEAINSSHDFAEATDWLHTHVSWNYNWSEENYTVQLFYGLISQFFASKA